MLLCFRQTELQVLLGVSSESRDGRKTDLMQRALSMIDRGVSPAVESKIRDLYRKSGASTSRNSLMYSRRLATHSSSSTGTSASSRSGRMWLNFQCTTKRTLFLWPRCVADADIIFLPCGFFYLLSFVFSSPILNRHRLDVYHTSTHGVVLVRI